jgi:hypothetical protein
MSESSVSIPLSIDETLGDFLKASDKPVLGEKRLVRLLPTPFGSREAIWISPYEFMENFEAGPERARVCIVLISKGPPKPDVACIIIPSAAIEKFPLVPVEW